MSELADLLERFRRGAELLAVATTGAAGTELDFQPGGKWSVRQLVCHVADAEVAGVMRFRLIIAEDNPALAVWDQNKWAANLDYEKRKISQVLDIFRTLRAWNYELLKDRPESTFNRTSMHSERGSVTLLEWLRLYSEHTENHVKQIHGVRAAYKEHRLKPVS